MNGNRLIDYYAPPKSNHIRVPTYNLSIFNSYGRIGRIRYIAWLMAGVLTVIGVFSLLDMVLFNFLVGKGLISYHEVGAVNVLLVIICFIFILSFVIRTSVKRLHDLNCGDWLAFALIIPLLNVLLVALLMMIPGSSSDNTYGAPPPANSKSVCVLAALFFILSAIALLFTTDILLIIRYFFVFDL